MSDSNARVSPLSPRYGVLELAAAFAVPCVVFAIYSVWDSSGSGEVAPPGPAGARSARQAPRLDLPDVQIAETELPADFPYQKNYDFTERWFFRNIPVWEQALSEFRGKPEVAYLEVGLFEGAATLWMLENILTDPTARATGVDIFLGGYKDRYFSNIEKSGFGEKVTTISERSQAALRRLPLESFDIIYIDGSHAVADVLEDAVLAWRLLKPGGMLIFDDYQLVMVAQESYPYPVLSRDQVEVPQLAIDSFALCFRDQYQVVHNGYQLILKKQARQTEQN